jgi:hypothetical protein
VAQTLYVQELGLIVDDVIKGSEAPRVLRLLCTEGGGVV